MSVIAFRILTVLMVLSLTSCGANPPTSGANSSAPGADTPPEEETMSYGAMLTMPMMSADRLRAALASAQKSDDGSSAARLRVVKAHFDLGRVGVDEKENFKTGFQISTEIIREDPDFPERDTVLFEMGAVLWHLDRRQDALDMFKRLIADHPRSTYVPDILTLFGDFYLEKGDIDSARKAYERTLNYPYALPAYTYSNYRLSSIEDGPESNQFLEQARMYADILRLLNPSQKRWERLVGQIEGGGTPDGAGPLERCQQTNATTIEEHRSAISANKESNCVLFHQWRILSMTIDSGFYSQDTVKEIVRLFKLVELANEGRFTDGFDPAARQFLTVFAEEVFSAYTEFARATRNPDLYAMSYFIGKFLIEIFDWSPKRYEIAYEQSGLLVMLQKWDDAVALLELMGQIRSDGRYESWRQRKLAELQPKVDSSLNIPSKQASKSKPKAAPSAAKQAPATQTNWPRLTQPASTTASSGPKDVALIVSVEDYAFLGDVPGATLNANAWETYFRRTLGVESVRVLANQDARKEEIMRFAKEAAEDVGDGGNLWFVFIGHGAPTLDGKDGLLIGMDSVGTYESMQARGVPREALLATLEKGKQARTIAIIDACFSGRDGSGQMLAKGAQPVIPTASAPRTDASTLVLSASRGDQIAGALPGADRPAFTYLLLGALRGWADDGDQQITADEAITFVRQQLRYVSGRQQTPQAHGELSTVLAEGGEADPGVARILNHHQTR